VTLKEARPGLTNAKMKAAWARDLNSASMIRHLPRHLKRRTHQDSKRFTNMAFSDFDSGIPVGTMDALRGKLSSVR
jgi:hypothetical protein